MKNSPIPKLSGIALALTLLLAATGAQAKYNPIEVAKKTAEAQIRRMVEPVIDKYCHDECKLLSISAAVDIATPDDIAPGFDEVDTRNSELAPTAATIKLLIDEKIGPQSRVKLTDLMQQYLDTLEYPVKIDSQIAKFPQPIGSTSKITELREQVAKQFKNTVEALLQQFCPEHCVLADLNVQTSSATLEEAQNGNAGEYILDLASGSALKIREIDGTLIVDDTIPAEERQNILEMAKLKTNGYKNVALNLKAMRFPRPPGKYTDTIDPVTGQRVARSLASQDRLNQEKLNKEDKQISTESRTQQSVQNSQNTSKFNTTQSNTQNSSEQNLKQERFERIEKIERVENGDAVQAELQKFKVFGLIFACSVLALLVFLAMASYRPRKSGGEASHTVHRVIQNLVSDPTSQTEAGAKAETAANNGEDRMNSVARRYEIERLTDELATLFATHPKVAKHVFSRILTEEGVEVTGQCIHIFGEGIVIDMLRDPSLQTDMSELMEYYAKNPIEMKDDERLELLKVLHNRAVAGKLFVMGNRSSNQFDFLAEMDGMQISELVRNESMTVKAIVLTQCDPQKRTAVYMQLDESVRMELLNELSRIDYLPRDYISNVANALKRKRRDNPKLNTEALPGSEVLVNLLERTGPNMQRTVVKNLEMSNPDSARVVKNKLVSLDTIPFLRDSQLLEVILSLRHDELLLFLKGAPDYIRKAIYSKSPKELVAELDEELANVSLLTRESYLAIERKVMNRMKVMANDGLINLVETNERMFAESSGQTQAGGTQVSQVNNVAQLKKVSGW